MLPDFGGPVRVRLGALPDRAAHLPLLELEVAEFEAVLGQEVSFDDGGSGGDAGAGRTDVWDVVVDPEAEHAVLRSDLAGRRLVLTIPDPADFMTGINLLHTLAYAEDGSVSDTEAPSYAAAFDRIRDEIAHIFPSMGLRGLDWDAITADFGYVRDLEGAEFWDHAARWVARLGDAHTQVFPDEPRFHPPYVAAMDDDGAVLLRVPTDSDGWSAGVRPGDRLVVEDPQHWLSTVGASPQHHRMIAARRFLAMTTESRELAATGRDGRPIRWTETRRPRPGLVAEGNAIAITAIQPDLPERLRSAIRAADPTGPLTIDLRANTGGNLVAAAEARRLLVREDGPFGTVAFTTGRGALAPRATLSTSPAPHAWRGDVHVLVDEMTYSAAEDFLHPLVGAPHVIIEGGPTGGGSGRPHTRLIRDGVRLATSTAITYTRSGEPIEMVGIRPTRSSSPTASYGARPRASLSKYT